MDPEDRAAMERQLPVTELIEQALIRREEVMEIVESSENEVEAEARIIEAFGVSDPRIARAVLDMQVRRWTRQERRTITAEAQRLRNQLAT